LDDLPEAAAGAIEFVGRALQPVRKATYRASRLNCNQVHEREVFTSRIEVPGRKGDSICRSVLLLRDFGAFDLFVSLLHRTSTDFGIVIVGDSGLDRLTRGQEVRST